jgi:hypothetical protein
VAEVASGVAVVATGVVRQLSGGGRSRTSGSKRGGRSGQGGAGASGNSGQQDTSEGS